LARSVGQDRTEFLAFLRYVRSLHLLGVRIAFVLDNFSPHLATKTGARLGEWASANDVELADTPHHASWLNRIRQRRSDLPVEGLREDGRSLDAGVIRRRFAVPA
jgi:hypothetical protein